MYRIKSIVKCKQMLDSLLNFTRKFEHADDNFSCHCSWKHFSRISKHCQKIMQTIIEFSIFGNAYIISMFMLLNCSSIQTQFFKQKIDADGEDVFRSNFAFIDRSIDINILKIKSLFFFF